MKKIICLLVLFTFACASTPKYPLGITMVPPTKDFDALIPPEAEPPTCPENSEEFEPIPVVDDETLPDGVLVDECTFIQDTATRAKVKRLELELDYTKNIRQYELDLIKQGESEYQKRIADLENKNWWERNKFELGLVGGALMTIGVIFGVNSAQ